VAHSFRSLCLAGQGDVNYLGLAALQNQCGEENRMKSISVIRSICQERRGVTAMEYGLIASLVAVVIITTLITLGGDLNNIFSTVAASL